MTYDPTGNILSLTSPNGGTATFTYDDTNRLVSMANTRGTITNYTYDSNGLLSEKQIGDETYTYAYQDGLLSESEDPAKNVTDYTYDPAGHILTESTSDGQKTVYTYDAQGNILTKSDALRKP